MKVLLLGHMPVVGPEKDNLPVKSTTPSRISFQLEALSLRLRLPLAVPA